MIARISNPNSQSMKFMIEHDTNLKTMADDLSLPVSETAAGLYYLAATYKEFVQQEFIATDEEDPENIARRAFEFGWAINSAVHAENRNQGVALPWLPITKDRMMELTSIRKSTWDNRMQEARLLGNVTKIHLIIYQRGGNVDGAGKPYGDANQWEAPQPVGRMLSAMFTIIPGLMQIEEQRANGKRSSCEALYQQAARAVLGVEMNDQALRDFTRGGRGKRPTGIDPYKMLKKNLQEALRLLTAERDQGKRSERGGLYLDELMNTVLTPAVADKAFKRVDLERFTDQLIAQMPDQ